MVRSMQKISEQDEKILILFCENIKLHPLDIYKLGLKFLKN
jgi:hypothetical protein